MTQIPSPAPGLPVVSRPDSRLPAQKLPEPGLGSFQEQSGLAVTEINGKQYALVPVTGGVVEANFVPRRGTADQLRTIAGADGELAAMSDHRGIAVLGGTPGSASMLFADNAGRTQVVLVPASGYTGGTVEVRPEVQTLAVLWETPPADRYAEPFPDVPLAFVGNREAGRPLRVVADFSVNISGTDSNVDAVSVNSSGDRVVADFILHPGLNRYMLLSQMGCSSLSSDEIGFPGAVSLGEYSGATGPYSLGIGTAAIAQQPGAIAFGRPAYSFFSNYHLIRMGGYTTGVSGVRVLLPDPDRAAAVDNCFRFDQIIGGATFSIRLDIIGRTATNYARFVREAVIHRSNAGALTLVTPTTPNTPSDVLSGGMSGAAVALSVDSTLNALQVQVTGPTTSSTVRWSCLGTVHALGDF
ncbi:MAG: hypothetical protein ACK4K3_07455 [Aquabacterium sp.]